MIFDKNLVFGENKALTASGIIGEAIDMSVANPNIGAGSKKFLAVVINTPLGSGASDGTVKFHIQDAATDTATPVTIQSGKQYSEGDLAANDIVLIPIPDEVQRYVSAYAELGGTSPTITVSAYIYVQ